VQLRLVLRYPDDPVDAVSYVVGDERGCLPILTAQLLAVAMGSSLEVCSNCLSPFYPWRARHERQRAFCDACRHSGAPDRYAHKDNYRRKARMAHDRTTVTETINV